MAEQRSNNNKKNGSYKGVGMIIAVITVLVGIGSVMQYMDREVGFLNERLERLSSRLDDIQMHFDLIGKEQAANQERFKEVETQFIGLKEKEDIINKMNSKKLDIFEQHVLENNAWRREHMLLEMGQKGEFDALKEKTKEFSAMGLGRMTERLQIIQKTGTVALIDHLQEVQSGSEARIMHQVSEHEKIASMIERLKVVEKGTDALMQHFKSDAERHEALAALYERVNIIEKSMLRKNNQ